MQVRTAGAEAHAQGRKPARRHEAGFRCDPRTHWTCAALHLLRRRGRLDGLQARTRQAPQPRRWSKKAASAPCLRMTSRTAKLSQTPSPSICTRSACKVNALNRVRCSEGEESGVGSADVRLSATHALSDRGTHLDVQAHHSTLGCVFCRKDVAADGGGVSTRRACVSSATEYAAGAHSQ